MRTSFFAIGLLFTAPAIAQHASGLHSPNVHAHAERSTYAGMQLRAIKSLSEQQISDLRNGKGMTLALAAELNGYPGPMHVIEMAEALGLNADQLSRTKYLYRTMQDEAKAMGEQLIASEAELDRLFKSRKVSLDDVQDATAKAGQLQGKLRAVHLKYHLSMVSILTPSQVEQYNRLRGYR